MLQDSHLHLVSLWVKNICVLKHSRLIFSYSLEKHSKSSVSLLRAPCSPSLPSGPTPRPGSAVCLLQRPPPHPAPPGLTDHAVPRHVSHNACNTAAALSLLANCRKAFKTSFDSIFISQSVQRPTMCV